jgi:hypothetical protein
LVIDAMRCPGCGSLVEIPDGAEEAPLVERDGMLSATPGRARITVAGEELHRCAAGRYLPPDRSY